MVGVGVVMDDATEGEALTTESGLPGIPSQYRFKYAMIYILLYVHTYCNIRTYPLILHSEQIVKHNIYIYIDIDHSIP